MNKQVLHSFMFFFLLVGCASTPQLGPEARAHLGAVKIDGAIDTPTEMYFIGQTGVLIGGLVGGAIDISQGEQLSRVAENNGIRIAPIVRDEVGRAFQDSGKLSLTDVSGANVATLKISITTYGFSVATGFSSELVPIIGIKCRLVDPAGKTIWSASETTHPLGNPAVGKTRDEFFADPRLIEASWRTATKSVMADIFSHM